MDISVEIGKLKNFTSTKPSLFIQGNKNNVTEKRNSIFLPDCVEVQRGEKIHLKISEAFHVFVLQISNTHGRCITMKI